MIDLIITGVIDGPLVGGTPKAVEFYVVNDIADLSVYGFGSANNGGGSDGQEYTFSGSARAGDYLYISSEVTGFTSYFGFSPTDTTGAANINGDDAIELFKLGEVVDVFGQPDVDGGNQPWAYTDGWAYRQAGITADGTFSRSQWAFSVPGALSEAVDNRGAAVPFPIGSFVANEIVAEAPPEERLENSDEESSIEESPVESPISETVSSSTITLISEIQGTAAKSPMQGKTVTVEATVVGDFQGAEGLSGLYLQEEDGDVDGDKSTSEGLFVFDGDLYVDVSVGDRVQVTGTVEERFDELTALVDLTNFTIIQRDAPVPTPAIISFPIATEATLEAAEGMLITIPDTLYVTEYFNYDRFGQITLSSDGPGNAPGTDGRLDQFTQFNSPDAAGFEAYQQAIATRKIILDDGRAGQNPRTLPFARGSQPLSATNPLRGGDTVTGLTGVLSFDFGNYRIQSNQGIDFQPTNPRPEFPSNVGGSLKVTSLNVLNFFTTLDQEGNPGSGPNNLPPRGADSAAEFNRQLEKLVTVIARMDADVVGLVELENEFGEDTNGDGQFAIGVLVKALNARMGAGTYNFVSPGNTFVDTGDAISVGAIYKPETVRIAAGTSVETLTDEDLPALDIDGLGINEPLFDGSSTNRASLAVTFEEIKNGETFTLAVNHFKSKGGNGSGDNADANDGQGNFNGTRTRGAQALAAWLASDPTGSGDTDFLIVGDLNAYAKEDPMVALADAGYTDLAAKFLGNKAYSFAFNGQLGTLDYALANDSLVSQVTGTTEWHINTDEPDAIDYNLEFNRDETLFNGQTPFRTSDHDPIIVGLELGQ